MNVKQLIMNTSFEDIIKVIRIPYGSEEKDQQRELYDKLKIMEPVPMKTCKCSPAISQG